jgi:excisionase family DNA binding protein
MSRTPEATNALYVRLPAGAAAKLDRAAQAVGAAKKDVVAALVSRYVDPDSTQGLGELGELVGTGPVSVDPGERAMAMGTYSFQRYELPEVLTPEQASELLQVPEEDLTRLAEAGELPGRRIGGRWRFSRAGLVRWLSEGQAP